jgi:hypothetical protein
MIRTSMALIVGSILLAGPAAAQKPDFSGSWKLDQGKSDPLPQMAGEGRPGGGRGMMTPTELFITQLSNRMTVELKSAEQTRTMSFNLDGSPSRNPGMGETEMVTTSTWVENTIQTKGKNTFKTPMGEFTIETTEIRSVSEDGNTMTVDLTVVTPRGTTKRKLVYQKQ